MLRADSPANKNLVAVGVRESAGQVLEFPVFSYTYHIGLTKYFRLLAVTACSHYEILSVLRQAFHYNISPILIHTHPQEYVKRTDVTYTTLRRNRINQARLKAVLRFLTENTDKFVTLPISAIPQVGRDPTGIDRPPIRVPARTAIARMIENGINDRIWWY